MSQDKKWILLAVKHFQCIIQSPSIKAVSACISNWSILETCSKTWINKGGVRDMLITFNLLLQLWLISMWGSAQDSQDYPYASNFCTLSHSRCPKIQWCFVLKDYSAISCASGIWSGSSRDVWVAWSGLVADPQLCSSLLSIRADLFQQAWNWRA